MILTLNGKVMENARQLEVNIYRHAIGERISSGVLRGAEKLKVEVAVGARDPDPERFSANVSVEKNRVQRLGVLGLTLDAKTARSFHPCESTKAFWSRHVLPRLFQVRSSCFLAT